MSSSVMLFQFIGDSVTNATDAFVTPAADNLISVLGPLAVGGLALYFVLNGYAIIAGSVERPFSQLLKQCIKVAIIAAFALNSGNYASLVVEAFKGLEEGLASAFNGGSPPTSIYATLDASLAKGFDLVGQCVKMADAADWDIGTALAWLIAALIVGIGTLLVTLVGAANVILAKFSLAIMFAVGPLFIMSLMWPVTARFFDSWFSQVINYTLQIVFMAVVMLFAMKGYDTFISAMDMSGSGADHPLFAALQIGGLTGVLMFIIYQVGGMASGLAGGVAMAAMTVRQLASPVSGATNAVTGTGRMLNPQSTRLDPTTGLQTTSSRLEHLAMGRSVFARSPAYRQALGDRMSSAWRSKGGNISKGK